MNIVILIVTLGWPLAAFCAYQWWQADGDAAEAEHILAQAVRQNRKLFAENLALRNALDTAYGAMKPEKTKPNPRYWGGRPLDRLMRHMDVVPTPDPPRLRVVDDTPSPAEVHSHATKGSA